MNKITRVNILRFIGLLLLQVLILNQVEVHGFISPFIYPLFILLLPLETPRAMLLLFAFAMGVSVDFFSNTPGLHAAALVFMAYARQFVITLNYPPGGYEAGDRPNIKSMGNSWFFTYALFCLILHHFFFFFIEAYSFAFLFYTLLKIFISLILSLILCLLYQYIFYIDY